MRCFTGSYDATLPWGIYDTVSVQGWSSVLRISVLFADDWTRMMVLHTVNIPVIKFVCDKSLNDGFDSSCSIGFPDPTNILYVVANWFTFLGSMVLPKYGIEISLFIRWGDNIWINNDMLDLWCNILFQPLFWWLPTIWLLSLLHFK